MVSNHDIYLFKAPFKLPTSRSLLLFSALVSGYDGVHIRTNVARLEEALKYGQSAGDRYEEP